jgi:hypothetical protein
MLGLKSLLTFSHLAKSLNFRFFRAVGLKVTSSFITPEQNGIPTFPHGDSADAPSALAG